MRTIQTDMMKEPERIMNGVQRLIWGALGLGFLAGSAFAGAWWHLLTAMLCLLMWAAHGDESDIAESATGHGKKEEGPWDTGC